MAETRTADQTQAQGQDFSIEESRAKRVERLQSKYRNRGGVFKPATHNALLDILLSRGVNGESPSKRRKSRKSIVPIRRESESPTVQRRKSLKSRGEEQGEPEEEAGTKGKGKATGRRKSVAPRKRKSVAPRAKKVAEEDSEDGQPVAGPSHTTKAAAKTTKRKKDDTDPEEEEPPKKAPKRAPPKKTTPTTKKAQEREDAVVDSAPPPKRTTGKRTRRQPEPAEQDSDDEPIVPPKRAKTAHTNKQPLETIPEESDSEEDIPLRLVVRSKATARDADKGPVPKAKQARLNAESRSAPKRPSARPPDADEDDAGEDARPPLASRLARPEPTSKSTKKVNSKSGAGEDALSAPKRQKAKGKVAVPDDDTEDAQPPASFNRSTEPLAKVPSTSRRKVPTLPEPPAESESDDEPPPPKTKASKSSRAQTKDAARPKNVDDPSDVSKAKEERTTASSAQTVRSGASSRTRGREAQATTVQPAEQESELDDQAASPADDEELVAPKAKRAGKAPNKRGTKAVEEAQDTSSGAPRKRGRGEQAAAPPTGDLDEQPQEPDKPPAPPRKRAKRAAGTDVDGLGDAPAEDAREPDDIQEEPATKPKSKPASHAKNPPASRNSTQAARKPKTLKENFPASRTSHQKAVPMYKPKPKPRMSMFPPPVLVADSDDDPIDFLS